MKNIHFSLFATFLLFVLLLSIACTKETPVQPQQNIISHPTPPQASRVDTLQVVADSWHYSPEGYVNNLDSFLKGGILTDVFASSNGKQAHLTPGTTAAFFSGQLTMNGHELVFSASYNQLPFHELNLILIVLH